MRLCDQLRGRKSGYLTLEQLRELAGPCEEEGLSAQILECVEQGVLTPVKSGGTNGNLRFPLYMKYRATRSETADEAALAEIRALHSALQRDGFLLRHPEHYREYREELRALSRWLFRHPAPPGAVSRKERSFEIFSEEKQLERDKTGFWRVLRRLGIDAERLAFYDTPSGAFYDYIPVRERGMTLLICENRDIWFNLRRMLFEKKKSVLWGRKLDGVLYGQGNQVTAPGSLYGYTRFLGLEDPAYLYWGDIDREGLNIYLRLRKANPELSIELFVPGYVEMLRRAEGRAVPQSRDRRDLASDFGEVYAAFPERWRGPLRGMIAENRRLPQEIISFTVLLQEMEEAP